MNPTVYLETAIIGYLAMQPSRVLRIAANQQTTQEWWNEHRHRFAVPQLLLNVVFVRPDSGGVLHNSVGEDSSFENKNDLVIRLSRRQRRLANWASLKIMVRLAFLELLPFLRRWRKRIVAKLLSIRFVVRRWPHCSAEKS